MTKEQNNQTEKKAGWWSRNTIAFIITIGVVLGTLFIAGYALLNPKEANFEFVGQALLPLWGTWLGTVLAFYFGKANFEAASKPYQEALRKLNPDDTIAKLFVKDVMLPIEKIEYLEYEKERDLSITDILNYSRFEKYGRYAILDAKKVVKYMIHRSVFLEFLHNEKQLQPDKEKPTTAPKALTLDNLLATEDPKIKGMLNRGYGFVSLNATVLDAKKVIDSIAECQDVFITQSGNSSEPVLGLLTNTMIFERAKI